MKQFDVKCPFCGTVNHSLFLEETNGWMECEHCHRDVRTAKMISSNKILIYNPQLAADHFDDTNKHGERCLG